MQDNIPRATNITPFVIIMLSECRKSAYSDNKIPKSGKPPVQSLWLLDPSRGFIHYLHYRIKPHSRGYCQTRYRSNQLHQLLPEILPLEQTDKRTGCILQTNS